MYIIYTNVDWVEKLKIYHNVWNMKVSTLSRKNVYNFWINNEGKNWSWIDNSVASSFFAFTHCPKKYLNLLAKAKPVSDGANVLWNMSCLCAHSLCQADKPDIYILLHLLQPWQARFLRGDSDYLWDSAELRTTLVVALLGKWDFRPRCNTVGLFVVWGFTRFMWFKSGNPH